MRKEDIERYVGFDIKLVLKNGFCYNCRINSKDDINEESVHVIDKYHQRNCFDISEIKQIREDSYGN